MAQPIRNPSTEAFSRPHSCNAGHTRNGGIQKRCQACGIGGSILLDYRLVRTAVVGSPRSKIPAYLPTTYREAIAFERAQLGKTFFCGVLLGGCGWPLSHRICRTRASHWAHHPDGPTCTRSHLEDSADHLYILAAIRRMFVSWGARTGVDEQIDMHDGRCRHIQVSHGQRVVRVQFSNLSGDVWEREHARLRSRFRQIEWIIGPSAASTADLIEVRKGYVLRAHCRTRNGTREVFVRANGRAGEFEWIPLAQCVIDDEGKVAGTELSHQKEIHRAAWKPASAPARANSVSAETATAANTPQKQSVIRHRITDEELANQVRTALEQIEAAMSRGDLANVESHLLIRKQLFDVLRSSSLDDEKARLTVARTWLIDQFNMRSMPDQKRRVATKKKSKQREKPSRHNQAARHQGDLPRNDSTKGRATHGKHPRETRKTNPGQQDDRPVVSGTPTTPATHSPMPQRPTKRGPKNNKSTARKECAPLTGQALELNELLRTIAKRRTTVRFDDLARQFSFDSDSLRDTLLTIELATPDMPLFSSLVVGTDGKTHSIFRDITVRLGYKYIRSDFGLELAGRTERERAYSHFAQSHRPMPQSALTRST